MQIIFLLFLLKLGSSDAEAEPEPKALTTLNSYEPVPYCANGGYCAPPVSCAPWYLTSLYDPAAACNLAPGTPGVCCPPRQHTYTKRGLLQRASNPPGSKSPLEFDTYSLNHAAFVGMNEVAWLTDFERELTRRRVFVTKGSAAFNHFAFFKSKSIARQLSDDSSISIFGTQSLAKRFSLTPDQAGFGLNAFSIKGTIIEKRCPAGRRCDSNSPYRSYDASCNNLANPLWGSSNSPFQRTLLPVYSDGVFRPKVAKSGDALPSARLISINIIPDVDAPSELDTHNVMQWGQFIDHDLTHTPLFRLNNENSSGIQCCADDGSAPISRLVLHPECFPIEIPSNDPFFRRFGQRCMNFVRSMPAPQQSCTFGYGEQMNQITHLHDASNVYGSDEEDAQNLRAFSDGLLKTYKSPQAANRELLPQDTGDTEVEECEIDENIQRTQDRKCFQAGDSRANEQPGLTVYHTVWVREHNRVAKELKYLNPHWNDERLYQEARKILIAEMQHITYNEWLPIILGVEVMDELDILPVSYGYNDKYDSSINPTILNSFATAAFRFGHTLIQGMLDLVEEVNFERRKVNMIPLREGFFNPELVYVPGELDKFLVGLATQPRQKYDNIFTEEITNHLFQAKNKSFGMDLVALNIQRGRDHALPGYNAFRELCGLGRVTSFDYLGDFIPRKIVDRFRLIYEDVDDIDLFIGGISETSAPGAVVGPTFQCIIGDQFKRLQHGDRFYYDSVSSPGRFTEPQLEELRNGNLARITCDNGDDIEQMQPLAFRRPSPINPLVPCDAITIPIVSLSPWQDGYQPPSPSIAPNTGVPIAQVSSLPITPAPTFNIFHNEPNYTPQPPAYPSSNFNSIFDKPVKSFVHSPQPRFNLNVNFPG